jgi:N-methylhydantoinase A/oxoprolinase/acetone carboxylase beta subunit
MATTTRRIGIDVGGTHTDAVLMIGDHVTAAFKTATTSDVLSGVTDSIQGVLDRAHHGELCACALACNRIVQRPPCSCPASCPAQQCTFRTPRGIHALCNQRQSPFMCADPADLDAVMIGTTQFVNALVKRDGLERVAVLRLCGPATAGLPPFIDMPASIQEALCGMHLLLKGNSRLFN